MMTRIAFPLALALSLALVACGGVEEAEDFGAEDLISEGEKADAIRTARFETFTGRDNQTYFHLIAGNGEKVLHSEGYTTLSSAADAIDTVRFNGAIASSYQLLEAANGQWYFNLLAGNWQTIATSELYVTKANAERGLNTVVTLIQAANRITPAPLTGARFSVFKGLDAKHYFNLRAQNGEIVLRSEGYSKRASAVAGTASVLSYGKSATRYQLKDAANGQTYFVIVAANGQTIGVSETYLSRSNAQRGADSVLALLSSGTIVAAQ